MGTHIILLWALLGVTHALQGYVDINMFLEDTPSESLRGRSTLETSALDSSPRSGGGADCWYDNYVCSHTPENVISVTTSVVDANECYKECKNGGGLCNHFTWRKFRRQTWCYKLRECGAKYQISDEWCLGSGACISGPSSCSGPPDVSACPIIDFIPGTKVWQCEDGKSGKIMSGYQKRTPIGGFCYQSCPAWASYRWMSKTPKKRAAYLRSECLAGGNWGVSQPNDVADGVTDLFYPKPLSPPAYPNPGSEEGTSCGCKPLTLIWPTSKYFPAATEYWTYNPRQEDSASMQCGQGRGEILNSEVMEKKEFTIVTGQLCEFFCDFHLVATVTCVGGKWTGEPELGYWCYHFPLKKYALKFVDPDNYN